MPKWFDDRGHFTNCRDVIQSRMNRLRNVSQAQAFFRFSRRTASPSSLLGRRIVRNMTSDKPPGRHVQVGEFRIHYEMVGTGNNFVFLMPGALGSSRTDFNPQLEGLDHKKWTIIAWDPPGYGYSRPPERTFPVDFFRRDAECAARLIEKVLPSGGDGVREVSVVGWSDGGITALIMTAMHPEIVRRLVVFGTNAYVTSDDLKLYEAIRDVATWSPRMRAPMEQLYGSEYFGSLWSMWVDAMNTIYRERNGDICKAELSAITCPTLILHGKKDAIVPQFHPDFLKANIENVRYIELEDGKHNLHQKYADVFNREVEKFLLD